jgi:hypothetical protein
MDHEEKILRFPVFDSADQHDHNPTVSFLYYSLNWKSAGINWRTD